MFEKDTKYSGSKIKKNVCSRLLDHAYFFVPHPKYLSTFKGFPSSAILFPHVNFFTKIKAFSYLRSLLKKHTHLFLFCLFNCFFFFFFFFFFLGGGGGGGAVYKRRSQPNHLLTPFQWCFTGGLIMTFSQSACHCHKLYCLLYVMFLLSFFVSFSRCKMGRPVYSV